MSLLFTSDMAAQAARAARAAWVSLAEPDLTDVWHTDGEVAFDESVRAMMWGYLRSSGLEMPAAGCVPRLNRRQQRICDAVHVAAAQVLAERGSGRYRQFGSVGTGRTDDVSSQEG